MLRYSLYMVQPFHFFNIILLSVIPNFSLIIFNFVTFFPATGFEETYFSLCVVICSFQFMSVDEVAPSCKNIFVKLGAVS
jgi:hypothetical protein